jgi:hypothetical protein
LAPDQHLRREWQAADRMFQLPRQPARAARLVRHLPTGRQAGAARLLRRQCCRHREGTRQAQASQRLGLLREAVCALLLEGPFVNKTFYVCKLRTVVIS